MSPTHRRLWCKVPFLVNTWVRFRGFAASRGPQVLHRPTKKSKLFFLQRSPNKRLFQTSDFSRNSKRQMISLLGTVARRFLQRSVLMGLHFCLGVAQARTPRGRGWVRSTRLFPVKAHYQWGKLRLCNSLAAHQLDVPVVIIAVTICLPIHTR